MFLLTVAPTAACSVKLAHLSAVVSWHRKKSFAPIMSETSRTLWCFFRYDTANPSWEPL